MSCAAIASGDQFLVSTLNSLECSGQQLGELGYQALAGPNSPIAQLLLALLTLFIAIHATKLMFGRPIDLGSASIAAIKIGLVLMLATSWPAVKTLFYDTAIKGPSELVAQMGGDDATLLVRLQRVDRGMVTLTSWGTGKLDIQSGRTAEGGAAASAFSGEALDEALGFGGGRLAFLVSVIGGLGLAWLGSGILVSLLPLFAGFLLFDATRGLAMGWLRAWLFLFLASLSLSLILAVEASLVEPWLVRVIAERASHFATPSAPIELAAMTGAFSLISMATLFLLARTCFMIDVAASFARVAERRGEGEPPMDRRFEQSQPQGQFAGTDRAYVLGQRLAQSSPVPLTASPAFQLTGPNQGGGTMEAGSGPSQSQSSRRRASQRSSLSSRKRDRR